MTVIRVSIGVLLLPAMLFAAAPTSAPANVAPPRFWSPEHGALVADTFWVETPVSFPDPTISVRIIKPPLKQAATIFSTVNRSAAASRGGGYGRGMEGGGRAARGGRSPGRGMGEGGGGARGQARRVAGRASARGMEGP